MVCHEEFGVLFVVSSWEPRAIVEQIWNLFRPCSGVLLQYCVVRFCVRNSLLILLTEEVNQMLIVPVILHTPNRIPNQSHL